MKSIHELLKLTLNHLNHNPLPSGLCLLIKDMKRKRIISINELSKIEKYMGNNKPNNKSLSDYWYKSGIKTYRRKWLIKHIELTKP